MLFGTWVVLGGTLLYIFAAGTYAFQAHYAWALVYSAYALANMGLVLAAEGFK
jgi:hypothetical protein